MKFSRCFRSVLSRSVRSQMGTLFAIIFICGALIASCSTDDPSADIIAKVNGKPITLSTLNARHDFDYTALSENRAPTLEELEEQYSSSLIKLIVSQLIDQFLIKNKMDVTPLEVEAEEKKIRADYPQGDFEKILVEEYVDMDMWREFLRQKLAREKLNKKILQPGIHVSVNEMEKYYADHMEEFNIPPRRRMLVVRSLDKKILEQLKQKYLETKDSSLFSNQESIMVHTISPQINNLPKDIKDLVSILDEGGITDIHRAKDKSFYPIYQMLIFIEAIPAENKKLADVYPYVEQVLTEQKLEKVFADWLLKELRTAKIEVSESLAKSVLLGPTELRRQAQNSRKREELQLENEFLSIGKQSSLQKNDR